MNIKYKLYLSLGLLFSTIESTTLAYVTCKDYSTAQIEEYCDDIIHSILADCFFNDQDTTPFYQLVLDIIEVLKIKRNIVDMHLQQKYDIIIALLEKNKDSSDFTAWGKILVGPDLKAILPLKTQQFLDSIPNFKKVKTLKCMLDKNK